MSVRFLLSRVRGRVPGCCGSSVPARRWRARAGAVPLRLRARARLVELRRAAPGPWSAVFAPPVLVAACPVCGARVFSRRVCGSVSDEWALCAWCGSSRLLRSSAWSLVSGSLPPPAAPPPVQLSLF